MSKGHMIMLGGVLEREDTSESRNQAKIHETMRYLHFGLASNDLLVDIVLLHIYEKKDMM